MVGGILYCVGGATGGQAEGIPPRRGYGDGGGGGGGHYGGGA